MNPRIQQDACEFVEILIDKLEKGLGKDFMLKMFGGSTVDTIEGIDEDYRAMRDQPFYTFPLTVRGSPNAESAFAKFQAVDYFTGANQYATSDGRKIDAKKFASFGHCPQFLIVHLVRFEFDFQRMEQTKIDTPFAFQTQLDLAGFASVDHRAQPTRYELVGIVLHSGTAAFGHYVSLVRNAKWLEYNDTAVSEIDEEAALRAAYGTAGHRNGYLLFYRRVDVVDCGDAEVSPELDAIITRENRLNDEYQLFCSSAYFELMKLLGAGDNASLQGIALQYFFDTLPFTTHVRHAREFASPLIRSLHADANLREHLAGFLGTGPFECALIYSPEEELRKCAREMLECVAPTPASRTASSACCRTFPRTTCA
jgi:hypothetical protein